MKLLFFIKNVRTLLQFNRFLDELSKDFTDPVTPTVEEAEAFFDEIRTTHHVSKQFYLVARSQDITLPFHHNTEKYINTRGLLTADKFLELTHPDYVADYLQWALATYAYFQGERHNPDITNQFLRLVYPMKLKDYNYHWVLMESTPFQLDKNRNLISHFNVYTILNPYKSDRKLPLIGELWDSDFRNESWTLVLANYRFASKPFFLTPSQRIIVDVISENPEFTNSEIALHLGKQKSTVETQRKQILAKAKESFPHRDFSTVKDLVDFLGEIGYLGQGFFPVTSKAW